MTEAHKTLNDPPYGPTPLAPGARRLLERLRDKGPLAIPGTGSQPSLQARLTRLAWLGYARVGPQPGWVEITENGILALTSLE
jgi:hypothetical protein